MLRFVTLLPTLQCKSVVAIVRSRPLRVIRKPIVFIVSLLIKLNKLPVTIAVDSLCLLILKVTVACDKHAGLS